MKKFILASVVLSFFSVGSFAATTAVKGTRVAKSTSTGTRSATVTGSHSAHPWRLGVGPSLGVVGGSFTFGASGDVRYRIANMFDIGGETGLYHATDVWFIPVMASGIFHPDIDTGAVHLYAGLSLGFNISFISASAVVGPVVVSASATKVYFEGLLRPGMEFNIGDSLRMFAEAKFGLVDSSFAFLPTVGVLFHL